MIKELDYIRTKDGRKGTVVLIHERPNLAYEIDFDDSDMTEAITPDEIAEVIAEYE